MENDFAIPGAEISREDGRLQNQKYLFQKTYIRNSKRMTLDTNTPVKTSRYIDEIRH